MEKDNNKKLCCYLMACSDIICFVGGALLLSLAIFGSACTGVTCTTCCGCLTYLGLPLIALGFVLRCWCCKGCCGTKNNCSTEEN